MMDHANERRIDVHDQRIRTAQIQAKLRQQRSAIVLLCDSFYAQGVLGEPQWHTLHIFRDDRLAFLTARSRGDGRKALPPDARARKPAPGFSMQTTTIERAKLVEKVMPCDYFQYALYLTGFQSGRVEPVQAQHTAWQLDEIYSGRYNTMRWKDGAAR